MDPLPPIFRAVIIALLIGIGKSESSIATNHLSLAKEQKRSMSVNVLFVFDLKKFSDMI
jgi:hypothetical protein